MHTTLKQEPRKFFMSLRDISFWIRSAQTDAHFEKLRGQHGSRKAFDLLYANKQDPFVPPGATGVIRTSSTSV